MRKLLVAGLASLLTISAWPAESDQLPQYKLKQPEPTTGTNIRSDVASGAMPFDKRYGELTPEQQGRLKSQYERMGPEDEPPFLPMGSGPFTRQLRPPNRSS